MRTWRSGLESPGPRAGRRRRPSCLSGTFTTKELSPTAAAPVMAARRPERPPAAKSSPAISEPQLRVVREAGDASQQRVERRRGSAFHGAVDGQVDGLELLEHAGRYGQVGGGIGLAGVGLAAVVGLRPHVRGG